MAAFSSSGPSDEITCNNSSTGAYQEVGMSSGDELESLAEKAREESSEAWRKRLAKRARRPGPSSMKPMHPRYFDYAAERSTTGTTPRTPRRRSSSRRDCTSINLTLRDLSHLGSTASRRTIAGTSSASEEPTGSGTTANRSSKNSKTKPQRLNRRFCSTRPSGTSVTPSPRSTIDLGSSSSSVTSPR